MNDCFKFKLQSLLDSYVNSSSPIQGNIIKNKLIDTNSKKNTEFNFSYLKNSPDKKRKQVTPILPYKTNNSKSTSKIKNKIQREITNMSSKAKHDRNDHYDTLNSSIYTIKKTDLFTKTNTPIKPLLKDKLNILK